MITPAYSPTATERVLPRLALDFTTASLDARVAVARALDTATVINSSGLVATVNANLPRFDYDPLTLVCKGLLIEESRTNFIQYSQRPDLTPWVTVAAVSFTTAAAVAPDGTTTAVYAQNTGTVVSLFQQTVPTVTCGTGTQTCTVFAKANTSSQFTLNPYFQGDTEFNATFTLTGSGSTSDPAISKIEAFSNGWYRCSVTYPARTGVGAGFDTRIWPNGRGNSGATGCYFWGFTQEAGAFATSYIATPSTATVTRNADAVTMTGTNFSSWFNASEGAFNLWANVYSDTAPTMLELSKTGSGYAELFVMAREAALDRWQTEAVTGSVTQSVLNPATNTFTINANHKCVFAYKSASYAAAADGTAVATSAGSIPTGLDRLSIGHDLVGGGNFMNGYVQKLQYWPQRLINAEVQAFSK